MQYCHGFLREIAINSNFALTIRCSFINEVNFSRHDSLNLHNNHIMVLINTKVTANSLKNPSRSWKKQGTRVKNAGVAVAEFIWSHYDHVAEEDR